MIFVKNQWSMKTLKKHDKKRIFWLNVYSISVCFITWHSYRRQHFEYMNYKNIYRYKIQSQTSLTRKQSNTFVHDCAQQVNFEKCKKITIYFELVTLKSLRGWNDRKAIPELLLRNTDALIKKSNHPPAVAECHVQCCANVLHYTAHDTRL